MSHNPTKRRKTNDGGTQITDPRFAHIHSDPRYRLPSKKQKVKLDKRFKTVLKGDDFVRRAKVDRYGRPVENEDARRRFEEKFDLDVEESDEPDDDDEVQKELERVEQTHDPLREGKLDASSSEDESSTDEDSGTEDGMADDTKSEPQDVPTGEVSTRIAIVNLDWDNIRAQDLMAVFSSFLPTGGRLLQVSVYPSEFGKERMEREEREGPPKEIFVSNASGQISDQEDTFSDDIEDDDEIKASMIKPDDGSEFDSQALRHYQLERLRYFYAILTFGSTSAAKHIYDAVDGTEYLSTANFFDLRFVPNEMDFSADKPRDECDHLPVDYKPNDFVTDALQHSKVKLTWDQEDRSRKEAQARAFKGGQKEIDENDLKAYLGSESSDSEQEDIDSAAEPSTTSITKSRRELDREKARALLGFSTELTKKSGNQRDQNIPLGNIQVTFSSGLARSAENEGKKQSVFENSPEPQETTAERYIRKEKERKQRRKEKTKAVRSSGVSDPDEPNRKDGADKVQEDLGFDDPFFDDSNLNDAAAKKQIRKEERLKKKGEREFEEAASAKQRAELELLMAEDDEAAASAVGGTGKGRTVRHFDMGEIERAEKNKGKSNRFKKRHGKGGDSQTPGPQDDFKMDVSDPRLGKLFENHEFAIDPTNQKLKQTSGMKELIEEGRKRKQKQRGLDKPVSAADTAKQSTTQQSKAGSNDVDRLVAKIKRKAR